MTDSLHGQMQNGKPGSGEYGDWLGNLTGDCIAAVRDEILEAVEWIPQQNGKRVDAVFNIGDFGTADGSASMPLIKDIIAVVRKKQGEVPVQVIYEDQSSNDFNSLFRRVHGAITGPSTYLNDFENVFALATGTGFYQQVMPDNTFNLILSFMSAHWLSDRPTKFQNSLQRFPDANEAELKLVAAHGAKDWERFLLLRAQELKTGGVLIVSTSTEDPDSKQGTRHCNQDAQKAMLCMWRRMRDEGRITNEEFVDSNFYGCNRYLEELRAPFEDQNSTVFKAGLRLVRAQQVFVPCSEQRKWQEKLDKENIDDRKTWARAVWKQHRCWSENSLRQGLSNTRSDGEKVAILDELYTRLETETASQDPRLFNNASLVAYVFAKKI